MVDYTVPLNYANEALGQTPAQVKSTYDYAKALMQGSGQQPIRHWTQGVSNIVNALVGGNLDFSAAQAEKLGLKDFASKQKTDIPAQNYPAAPVGTLAPPPFPAPLPSGGDNGMDRSGAAISGIESGGKYDAVGPVTKTGDRAYGKYQIMGNNIPEWTETATGKRMTPDEFVRDQAAQEAVFKHKFGEYTQKYGPESAAKAWFAGEQGMDNPKAADVNGMTVERYGQKFANAFAGPDDVSKVPAVAAMSAALRGGPSDADDPGIQVAGSKAVPTPTGGPTPPAPNLVRPDPSGGQTLINPALIKPQPGYIPSQLQAVMEHPFADPAQREAAHQMMLKRGQTVEMRSPTGVGTILVDPNDPRVQQYIAPEPHWGTKKVGETGVEYPTATTFDSQGRPIVVAPGATPTAPMQRSPILNSPRSEAPVAPTEGGLPTNGVPGIPVTENAPAVPATVPDVPVQVASTDPAAGVTATVGKPTVPPVVPTPVGPLAQAMQTAPPGVSQGDFDTIQGLKKAKLDADAAQHQRINNMDVDKEAQTKAADAAIKKYDSLSTQAASARKLMPNLDLALALMNDPNFHSGLLSGAQDTWARLKTAALGDKYANAPNESFDKLMAGTVLDTMKSTLAGLGQVRLAEIDLLNRANANRYNTDASNRAVLEISRRAIQKVDQLDELGQQYASGGEVADPVSRKILLKANVGSDGEIAPRRGLDVGYDKLARKFVLEHPSFNADEIKHYQTIFDTGRTEGDKTATGKTDAVAPMEKDFSDGKGGVVKGYSMDGGKTWGPKK